MTDLVFLLLLFFVLASTMATPNDLKINLPQSHAKQVTRNQVAKVSIDNLGNYSVALNGKKPVAIDPDQLEAYLCGIQQTDSAMHVALHADQDLAYKEVVRVLDIANTHHMKLVIATSNAK